MPKPSLRFGFVAPAGCVITQGEKMKGFPKEKIKAIMGKLSGPDGDLSLEITLEPFELTLDDYSERVETSIRLDCINLSANPSKLEGKTFDFPVNPEDGYIDGSIYFFSAHNPVDITKITFGKIEGKVLPIELKCHWILEFENSGFKNFESTIKTQIEL